MAFLTKLCVLSDCSCDNNPTVGGAKLRPVIRTYSAPLPLTNPSFFQPNAAHPGGGGMGSLAGVEPFLTPPTEQEMYNIKQHVRNNILKKSTVSVL